MLKPRVNAKDAKVSLSGFRYSATNQQPPLETVLKSTFWTAAQYESLHQRLSKPVPDLHLRSGGDLVTIDTQKERASLSEMMVKDTADEHEVCFAIVLMCLPGTFKTFLIFCLLLTSLYITDCLVEMLQCKQTGLVSQMRVPSVMHNTNWHAKRLLSNSFTYHVAG